MLTQIGKSISLDDVRLFLTMIFCIFVNQDFSSSSILCISVGLINSFVEKGRYH